jgi:predicted HD phosphohydrolase
MAMDRERAEANVQAIVDLYAEMGLADYIGEAISQVEHATQCAACARAAGADDATVIGALLHGVWGEGGHGAHGERGRCA